MIHLAARLVHAIFEPGVSAWFSARQVVEEFQTVVREFGKIEIGGESRPIVQHRKFCPPPPDRLEELYVPPAAW